MISWCKSNIEILDVIIAREIMMRASLSSSWVPHGRQAGRQRQMNHRLSMWTQFFNPKIWVATVCLVVMDRRVERHRARPAAIM